MKRQRQTNQPACQPLSLQKVNLSYIIFRLQLCYWASYNYCTFYKKKIQKFLYVFQGDFPQDLLVDIFSEFIII